jgi:biotin transport system permease protein
MLIDGLAPPTWLHRVPPGLKLGALALLSLVLLPIGDWRILAASLVLITSIYAGLGVAGIMRLEALRPLLPLLAIVGGLQAASKSLNAGAVVTMRLLALVLLAELVSMSTSTTAMIDALEPLLRVLRPLGVNPRKVALAVALVLRFVPLLLARWRAREAAWKARSPRRVPLRLVAVYVTDILRLADRVAEALDARGFDAVDVRRQPSES